MKAQISYENLLMLCVMFIIFSIFLALMSDQSTGVAHMKKYMAASKAASSLGTGINAIFLAGNSTHTVIWLEESNASIWADAGFLNVMIENMFYSWPLFTNNTNISNLSIGAINITNINGLIRVENA